jgi:hypothetical protein
MSIERGAELQDGFATMGVRHNFKPPPIPYMSVKLMNLGDVGRTFVDYYGDTITWDQFASLKLTWGDNTVIKYNGVQPGWTYWWEIGLWEFIVTDNLGNKTVETVSTLSDLGITWDILESSQFSMHISARFVREAFLKAWRYKRRILPCNLWPTDYLWGEFDKYLNDDEYDSHFERLRDSPRELGFFIEPGGMLGELREQTLMPIRDYNLDSTGNFPTDMWDLNYVKTTSKATPPRIVDQYEIGTMLMIYMFASIMNASKPVFEPWMLWKMWQWFVPPDNSIVRDRVFDLSPWWG